jgi:hypothetical protein
MKLYTLKLNEGQLMLLIRCCGARFSQANGASVREAQAAADMQNKLMDLVGDDDLKGANI